MPEVHAILSASSSKRWLNCTPSARLEQNFPNESSVYAEEGTAAHALGEYKLRKYLHERVQRPTSEYENEEMEANTDIYAEFIISTVERIKETCPHPLVMVEERLDYSYLVPSGFGTGDCVIIADGTLYVMDYKNGKGVYEYQRYCTEYIKTHPIAALFLDMGLGKTVITLSAIKDLMLETFEVSKVLIIAPLRVARDTWPAEIEKWDHLKGLDISVIVGDVKTRIAAVHHPAMIYIVNRENIRWLVEYYEKNGMRWDFSMIVIDELSSFKNYQSQRFKFLRKVRPFVKRWVGLTGTPSSNGLMDLWAEIGILDGGERLGKFIGRYREAYFKAGALNPATGIVFQYVPRQGAEEMIYQRISDITISMKALDYLNMPDCVPTRCEVEMNTQERELYDMLRQDLLIPLKDGDIDAANAASLTGKLLQMSNGAVYDENGKVCDIRTMVRVDENFEVRSELKTVLMQIPGCDRIVTGQSFGKSCIQSDLFLRLGDVYKTRAGKPGDFLSGLSHWAYTLPDPCCDC